MAVRVLSEDEIELRWPLWVALSDTFLDTELTDDAYRRIAETISASAFHKDEARAIYREDVAPAFAINLLATAGEWSGWDEQYVRERVLEARNSLGSRLLVKLLFRGHIRDEWGRIKAFL